MVFGVNIWSHLFVSVHDPIVSLVSVPSCVGVLGAVELVTSRPLGDSVKARSSSLDSSSDRGVLVSFALGFPGGSRTGSGLLGRGVVAGEGRSALGVHFLPCGHVRVPPWAGLLRPSSFRLLI